MLGLGVSGQEEPALFEVADSVPESVSVPRLAGAGVEFAAVSYPLARFPWPVWTLTAGVLVAEEQAEKWAAWLNEVGPARVEVIRSVLSDAGAPVGAVMEEPQMLLALGEWVQRWFRLMVRPDTGGASALRRFFQEQPELRLGGALTPWGPRVAGYSLSADTLLHTVAMDLAFLVCAAARVRRPSLRWHAVPAGSEPGDRSFITVDPDPPPFPILNLMKDFLVQATARPRGLQGRELREWRSQTLYRCYERAATGAAQVTEREAFPCAIEFRHGGRYFLYRPRPADSSAPAELVELVTAFRQAGWFDAAEVRSTGRSVTWSKAAKLTDADLARAVQAAWLASEHQPMPSAPPEIAWRVLLLDGGRTWSEDIDADAQPGENIHDQTLGAIAGIAGKGFNGLRDVTEEWPAASADVELGFWLGRRHHQLVLPSPGRHLSPALITGLNELASPDGPRLWFVDQGAPYAIVTRATAAERDALQRLTGLRLDTDPPAWWTASLPS